MARHIPRSFARYSPRFLAAVRRRYEETDQSVPSIAWDFEISARTLYRMVDREGRRTRAWPPPPRDLSRPAQLLEEATALEREFLKQRGFSDAYIKKLG